MRPVDKGSHPEENGKRVEFNSYQDAAPYLKERLGRFCSYCERDIPAGLAVEHKIPKSHDSALEKEWDNLLLACINCNSSKGKKLIEHDECLWPDKDDTFSAFTYKPSGAIEVSTKLDSSQQEKARALLALVELNKAPSSTDNRYERRYQQWGKAKITQTQFQNMPNDLKNKFLHLIVTEGYSIWATVFRSDPVILDVLAKKFPGTRPHGNL